jgi:hypothetical protein
VKFQILTTKICKGCGEEFPNNSLHFPSYSYTQGSKTKGLRTYTNLANRCSINNCFRTHQNMLNNISISKGTFIKADRGDDFDDFSFTDSYFESLTYDDLSIEEKKLFKNK